VIRIVVDRDACEGNGVCVSIDPEVFALDNDDVLTINSRVMWKDERAAAVRRALESCPKRALANPGA